MIIKHFKTNPLVIKGQVIDEEGKIVRLLAGDVVYFTVKKYETDSNYIVNVTGDIVDMNKGEVMFNIPAHNFQNLLGEYVYDITLVRGGNPYTLVKGSLLILLPVR